MRWERTTSNEFRHDLRPCRSRYGLVVFLTIAVASLVLGSLAGSCRCTETNHASGRRSLRIGEISTELEVFDARGEPLALDVELNELVRQEATKAPGLTVDEERGSGEERSRLRVRVRIAADGATGEVNAMVLGRLDRGRLIPLSWELDLVSPPGDGGQAEEEVYREVLTRVVAQVIEALDRQVEVVQMDVPQQIVALESSEPAARAAAATALAEQHHRAAVEPICGLLSAAERTVVEAGVESLVEMGDHAAAPCLIAASEGEAWRLEIVVEALSELGGNEALAFLETTSSEGPSSHARRLAEDGARRIRGDDARSKIKGHDHDHDEHEDSPAAGYVKALTHEEREVRVGAARVLAKMRRREAVPPLCDLLDHQDVETAAAAFEALVQIGDDHAVPCFLAWADGHESRLVLVIEALATIGGGNATSALSLMARDHESVAIRRQARAAMERMATEAGSKAPSSRLRL